MKTVDQLDHDDVVAVFFTDPHLGANRVANTTPKTRKELQQELCAKAFKCTAGSSPVFLLGDLFDSYSNSEPVLLQGMSVAEHCEAVMAGNHDVHADINAVGSLQALQSVRAETELYRAEFGQVRVGYENVTKGGYSHRIVMIPHHTDQALFEEALRQAVSGLEAHEYATSTLCLHCNYNLPWDTTDTALNLTDEMARDLLNHFDYVLLGHDHHPKVELDGRLIVLGNTHPTGFGDISDKYRYALLKDGSMVRERIWSKDENYAKVDLNCLTAAILPEWVEAGDAPQFIDLVGEVDAGAVVELNRTIGKLWGAGALAIRNRVTVAGASVEVQESGHLVTLSEQIEADLGDRPEQLALWRELSGEAA